LPLLATAAAFQSASLLDVAPGVRVNGEPAARFTGMPFGANDFHTPGSFESTCNDWTGGTFATGLEAENTKPFTLFMGCGVGSALCLQQ
jgi:hypothetical protein